jgi:hypothetical protein
MSSTAKRLLVAVFDQADLCQRENDALRTLLHRQGLSDATIRRRVARILDQRKDSENALQRLKRVCEEALARLPDYDIEAALAELPIRGKPQ